MPGALNQRFDRTRVLRQVIEKNLTCISMNLGLERRPRAKYRQVLVDQSSAALQHRVGVAAGLAHWAPQHGRGGERRANRSELGYRLNERVLVSALSR